MEENIYTIPVIDAFSENNDCPFCKMYKKLNDEYLSYTLGPAYMEDDIRLETNKKGFCKHHFEQLYKDGNRLGMSLIVHTHLQDINKNLSKMLSKPLSAQKKGFFSKTSTSNSTQIASYLKNTVNSCYICDKIDNTFTRYIDTFFLLYKKNGIITEHLKSGHGFCLSHFSMILEMGEKNLSTSDFKDFCGIIVPKQLENISLLEEQLDWFIKKFDYRFTNEPWKDSKDALPRTIFKISSLDLKDK